MSAKDPHQRKLAEAFLDRARLLVDQRSQLDAAIQRHAVDYERRDSKEIATLSSLDNVSQQLYASLSKAERLMAQWLPPVTETAQSCYREGQRVDDKVRNAVEDAQTIRQAKERRRQQRIWECVQQVDAEKLEIDRFYAEELKSVVASNESEA